MLVGVRSKLYNYSRPCNLVEGLVSRPPLNLREESLEEMSIHRKLMTVCCAVVLAFGLAACGSSDDDTAATDTPTVEEPAGPTQADLDAEKKRADAAEKELADKTAADAKAKNEGLFKAIRANVNGTGTEETGDPVDDAAYDPKTKVKPTDSVVMDDKGADTTLAFAKHYAARLTAGPATGDILDLEGTGGRDDATEPGAASDGFPKNGGSVVYTDDDASDDLPASVTLPGTLMGAKGTYACAGAACEISEDKGKYTFSTGWTFDPDSGTTVTLKDDDYSRWGWWAFKRKDGTFRVETFAVATSDDDDIDQSPGDNLGSATYMGSAAGKYAIDNRPTGDTLEAAHFDASATITADLTGLTASGTIDNFMVDGEERDWSVSLGRTDIAWGDANADPDPDRDIDSSDDVAIAATDTTPATAVAGSKNVWTIGGVKGGADGDWQADFHHNGAQRNDQTPAVVIGQFTASHGTIAYMTGAFGAHNMAPDTPE